MSPELLTKAELYKSMVDQIPYSTGLLDINFKYIYYNKAAEEMLEVPLEEAIGKTPYDIIPHEFCVKFMPLIEKVKKTKTHISERLEFNVMGADVILSVYYAPILGSSGEIQGIVGITEDLTGYENQRSEALASTRLASLGLLAANITHEINNPLQIIQLRLGRIEEMIKEDPTQTERLFEELHSINRTTERMSRIVEGMRRQSKQHAHEHKGQTYISEIIEEAIKYSRNQIESTNAELLLNIKKDSKVSAKPIEIEQVLINLIGNACEAIIDQDDKWIEISSFEDDGCVVLQVKDSGTGISKENQKKLMQPFFTTKDFSKGTGLGLNISRTMMRRNQGSLKYLSEEPYTTFEIKLPKA